MNLDKLTYKTIVLQIKAITLQLKYFNIKLLKVKWKFDIYLIFLKKIAFFVHFFKKIIKSKTKA